MTDQKLDQMMRRALLDAAAQEAEALPQEPPELSPRHGRSMRAMLRDPLAWARSRRRPALRTAARHAAAVLLVLVLSAAVLVTVSPGPGRISPAGWRSRPETSWTSSSAAIPPPSPFRNIRSPPCRRDMWRRSGQMHLPPEM